MVHAVYLGQLPANVDLCEYRTTLLSSEKKFVYTALHIPRTTTRNIHCRGRAYRCRVHRGTHLGVVTLEI